MYYKGKLRKEVTPVKLKSFLELVSYNKYNSDELYELIYPLAKRENKGNFNLVYKFAKDLEMIQELSGGKVIYNEDTNIKISTKGLDEEAFKEYIREALFSSEESLFYNMTKELISYDMDKIFFQRDVDIISILKLNQNINNEDMLSYRFWSKYLGYSYNLRNESIIINPYKYIDSLNKKILKKNNRMAIRNYIEQLQSRDSVFNDIVNENEISQPVGMALKTLEGNNKLRLILENDAGDLWRLRNITEYDDERISHIELEV